jgi:DnaJ domain
MRRAASFAQALEQALATDAPQVEPLPRSYAVPQVLGFFDFSAPGRQPFASSRAWRPAPPPTPRRLVRHLTTIQQNALHELNALGASLARDFTDAELRAAFRDLARRYHPDRHPRSSDAERARLAMLFARTHSSYRVLQTVVARTAN